MVKKKNSKGIFFFFLVAVVAFLLSKDDNNVDEVEGAEEEEEAGIARSVMVMVMAKGWDSDHQCHLLSTHSRLPLHGVIVCCAVAQYFVARIFK